MPTITNYGDVVITGNTTGQGTGSSTFAGSLGCAALTATSVSAGSGLISTSGVVSGGSVVGTHYGVIAGSNTISGTSVTATLVSGGSVVGTLYGTLAGSNTISGTSVTATSVSAGSGLISTSGVVSGGSVVGTHYGVIAGSNTISGSTMSLTTPLSVANGGSGAASFTAYTLIAGGTTSTGAYQSITAGTANQFLVSAGSAAIPSWRVLAATDLPTSGVTAGTTGSATSVPVITYDTYGRLTTVSAATISTNPISGGTANAIAYATSATALATAPGIILTNPSSSDGTVVLTCSGDIVAYSDRNIKTNIEPILDALEKVTRIGGYTFNRTDGGSLRRTGVIAQEVQEVLPEAVYETENGTLTVAYGNMVGLLIEAIKELREEVKRLETSKE